MLRGIRRFDALKGVRFMGGFRDIKPSIAPNHTHHVLGGDPTKPLYSKTYKNVLSFHTPENLAAVEDMDGQSYHIDFTGQPAYPQRYKHTFGFYSQLAAVCN
jgi:hypothetical protein